MGSSKSTWFLSAQPPTRTTGIATAAPIARQPVRGRTATTTNTTAPTSQTGCSSARVIAAAVIAATKPTRWPVERVRAYRAQHQPETTSSVATGSS